MKLGLAARNGKVVLRAALQDPMVIQRISEDIRTCLFAWKAVKASAESLRNAWCLPSSFILNMAS